MIPNTPARWQPWAAWTRRAECRRGRTLSEALARRGHQVTVYTRRTATELSRRVKVGPGFEVVHVDAGPPRQFPRTSCCRSWVNWPTAWPGMGPAAPGRGPCTLLDVRPRRPPRLPPGIGWLPGPRHPDLPRTGLGQTAAPGRRGHQPAGQADGWNPGSGAPRDWIIATCPDEVFELKAMGIDTGQRFPLHPAAWTCTSSAGTSDADPKPRTHRILTVGRLVQRKGVDLVIRPCRSCAQAGFADVELLIVGGSGDRCPPGRPGGATAPRPGRRSWASRTR